MLDELQHQSDESKEYPLTSKEKRVLANDLRVRTPHGRVAVQVPETIEDQSTLTYGVAEADATPIRESQEVQAKIADLGARMGFRIWVPRNDRFNVLLHIADDLHSSFLEDLPLNYDDSTIKTIEQIDVIWIQRRSIVRAFEVEHTTAIYSGLLRMADLLALQPNMKIHLHIAAPDERREKVLEQIKRPVFSLLDSGPLYEICSFLSYDALAEFVDQPNIEHLRDTVVENFIEYAEG